jgi:polysaccharide export outer membrane protein
VNNKKMKIKNLILLSSFGIALLTSCVANKKYILLQNAKTSTASDTSKSNYQLDRTIYKLQVNDILYVSVASTDETISKAFSHSVGTQQMMQVQGGLGSMLYLIGYSINQTGEINLPIIGNLKVSGLSVTEAKQLIDVELKKYFKVYHLVVQLTEMPFTVIGEVARAGRFSGMVNQVTIMEALALAGDFTSVANRKNVTIIRQNPEGVKVFKVDFTQADLINSPYYILRPNDVIYVEPLKSRSIGNFSSFQSALNTITPLLTTLVLALNTYIIITR